MLTSEQLKAKKQFAETDKSRLVDIHDIKIDTTLPADQRMKNYLEQIKNPYCFRHGNAAIHVRFAPEGADLRQKLKSFFIGSKTK